MSEVAIYVAVVGSLRAWRMWVFQNSEKFVSVNRGTLIARDANGREYFSVAQMERIAGRDVHEVIALSDADATLLGEAERRITSTTGRRVSE